MFGKKSDLKEIDINGVRLKCLVCGHKEFAEREALLNTSGMTFMNLDWANKSAMCLVCDNCGYVHWFLPE